MVGVEVRPAAVAVQRAAAVAVVQIAEEEALLQQVQAEQSAVPVAVVAVVEVPVLVLVSAVENKSDFHVRRESERVTVDKLRH